MYFNHVTHSDLNQCRMYWILNYILVAKFLKQFTIYFHTMSHKDIFINRCSRNFIPILNYDF